MPDRQHLLLAEHGSTNDAVEFVLRPALRKEASSGFYRSHSVEQRELIATRAIEPNTLARGGVAMPFKRKVAVLLDFMTAATGIVMLLTIAGVVDTTQPKRAILIATLGGLVQWLVVLLGRLLVALNVRKDETAG